jgi:ankyrin repeat protein
MTDLDRRARHRDSSGRTALHRRAKRNDLENARQLLAHGADVNCRDNAGWSPLHEAALAGHANMVRLLLSHGANVAVQAENLDTPLHDAAEAGYVEVVQLLLEAGASPTIKNEQGRTPLDLVDVESVKDDEERHIATEIRELLVAARRSQNRRSRVRLTSMDNKRVTGKSFRITFIQVY